MGELYEQQASSAVASRVHQTHSVVDVNMGYWPSTVNEVKTAGYWPSSFSVTQTESGSIKSLAGKFFLRDTASSPEWSYSGSQSCHWIWLILPAHRAGHNNNRCNRLLTALQFVMTKLYNIGLCCAIANHFNCCSVFNFCVIYNEYMYIIRDT